MPDPLFKVTKFPYSLPCIKVNIDIIKLHFDLLLKCIQNIVYPPALPLCFAPETQRQYY